MRIAQDSTPNRSPRLGRPIYIVIHRMEGYMPGTIAVFHSPAAQASADYAMTKDGKSFRCFNRVDSGFKSWAVGGDANNPQVSIETEGFVGDEHTLGDAFFDGLAELCIYIQGEIHSHYGNIVPLHLTHTRDEPGIIGHHELSDLYGGVSDHTCPGNFPFERLIAAIQRRTRPEPYLQVRSGAGGDGRRFILGHHAAAKAVNRAKTLLKKGRNLVTIRRMKG